MKYTCNTSTGEWERNQADETCSATSHCYCSYKTVSTQFEPLSPAPCNDSGIECYAKIDAALDSLMETVCSSPCDTYSSNLIFGVASPCQKDCMKFYDVKWGIRYQVLECLRSTDTPYPIVLHPSYGYTEWGMYSGE